MKTDSKYQVIYEVVRRIPPGQVATYGQVAKMAGQGGHARQVGYALHRLSPASDVPWHRVVNAQGKISLSPDRPDYYRQMVLLEGEGIIFQPGDIIPLQQYQWKPGR